MPDASIFPIACNGNISGVNFGLLGTGTTTINGLTFTAAHGCLIDTRGVTFRNQSIVGFGGGTLALANVQLLFTGATVYGPIRLTATSVVNTLIALRAGTVMAVTDCSIVNASSLTGAVAVLGVGIAVYGTVTSSTVEVSDSTVSCNAASNAAAVSYSGVASAISTVGVVGVAAAGNASDVTVVFSNANVTSLRTFNVAQVTSSGHSLVGIAGIAATAHLRSNVAARRSIFRAPGFVGTGLGQFVAGVGAAGFTFGATDVSVAVSDHSSVSISGVSVPSLQTVVGAVGVAVYGGSYKLIKVDVQDAALSITASTLGDSAIIRGCQRRRTGICQCQPEPRRCYCRRVVCRGGQYVRG
jgi:hypothetical protein